MTDTIIVALIACIPATIGLLSSLRNGRKSNEIHVLVNGRMAEAKDEIINLKAELVTVRSELIASRNEVLSLQRAITPHLIAPAALSANSPA